MLKLRRDLNSPHFHGIPGKLQFVNYKVKIRLCRLVLLCIVTWKTDYGKITLPVFATGYVPHFWGSTPASFFFFWKRFRWIEMGIDLGNTSVWLSIRVHPSVSPKQVAPGPFLSIPHAFDCNMRCAVTWAEGEK